AEHLGTVGQHPAVQPAAAARAIDRRRRRRRRARRRAGRRGLIRHPRPGRHAAAHQNRADDLDRERDHPRARRREFRRRGAGAGPVRYASANPSDGKAIAYATEGTADPYVGFEARVVPENITLLPKTAAQATGGNAGSERTITIKKGESVSTVLRDLGALPE